MHFNWKHPDYNFKQNLPVKQFSFVIKLKNSKIEKRGLHGLPKSSLCADVGQETDNRQALLLFFYGEHEFTQ